MSTLIECSRHSSWRTIPRTSYLSVLGVRGAWGNVTRAVETYCILESRRAKLSIYHSDDIDFVAKASNINRIDPHYLLLRERLDD